MHILYVDESGLISGEKHKFFVLAGVSVFERQTHWLSRELDNIASRYNPAEPQEIELHGSDMRGGKKFWRKVPASERQQTINDSLGVLAESHKSNCLFAVGVSMGICDPMEYAYTQLVSRFDQYLMRLYKAGNKQRGIILFDKSKHERALQSLTTLYKKEGHQWGQITNLAEVPVFIDSKASRLIQLADLVAYAVSRKLNNGDESFFNIIAPRFDYVGGRTHGLHIKVVEEETQQLME